MKKLHIELMKSKEEKYLASIPKVSLTQLEQNIIVGSILGDGNLTYAPRSRNAYYREHFSIKQKEYREWKMNNIHSMKFRIEKECHLKSPSHPVFTELYDKFYINGIKTITEDNIKLLNHPIGLACLYMDDGTLMISASKSKGAIRIHPTIGISTLSFSKEGCEILS
ncbi:MAG: endonuclease, partial [Bacillota bacterium]|nr:endonuclease [Bacillota bacterium]